MDTNANPTAPVPQPIQDVLPPQDSLGNPESFAVPVAAPPPTDHINRSSPPLPSRNPIAGTAMAQSQALQDGPVDDHGLDGVLKDVTSNIKATSPALAQQRKPKFSIFGIFKRKPKQPKQLPPPPQSHAAPRPPAPQPVQQSHSQSLPSSPQAAQPAKNPLKSGPTRLKQKSKIPLPAVAAVIVAVILVVIALSAFKN